MAASIYTLHQQALKALSEKKYQTAHQHLLTILHQDQSFADAYFLLAIIASDHQNIVKAIELTQRAIKFKANNIEYLTQLAKLYASVNDHVNALVYVEQAAKLPTKSALILDTLGVLFSQIGLHQRALCFFEKATQKNNKNPQFHFNLAICQTFIGMFEQARLTHQKVLNLQPNFCKSHLALSNLSNISQNNNHIESLTTLYHTETLIENKLCLGHAVAREYEALKNYQRAFEFLKQSKQLKHQKSGYNFSQDREMFSALHHCFGSNDKRLCDGFNSDEAIFVVGMPRTGTTLVERIISKHADVTSAGELQYFATLLKELSTCKTQSSFDKKTIEAANNIDFSILGRRYIESTRALTGKTKRFVDKMPFNVLYVGFIVRALPNAKIICLDRNPLDTIISNYRQLFTANSAHYNYAYDLTSITEFYLEFKRLVRLWSTLFPENFYLVNYENLVNYPEDEAKNILDFCQLSWQDDCLNSHDNSAPVATASAVQVRQPINNKSIGNWKKYDFALDEVKKRLADNCEL